MIGYKNEFFEILEFAGKRKNRQLLWKCKCNCGNISILDTTQIKKKLIKSCGCSRKGKTKGNQFGLKHGLCIKGKENPIYKLRNRILTRCYNAKPKDFPYYQGRGIKVCEEWINNPTTLCNWALINGWEKGLVLDRIDPDGDYSPNNCQFLTVSENLKKMHKEKHLPKVQRDVIKHCSKCKCAADKEAPCKKPNI